MRSTRPAVDRGGKINGHRTTNPSEILVRFAKKSADAGPPAGPSEVAGDPRWRLSERCSRRQVVPGRAAVRGHGTDRVGLLVERRRNPSLRGGRMTTVTGTVYAKQVGNRSQNHPSSIGWERISCSLPRGCGLVPESESGSTPKTAPDSRMMREAPCTNGCTFRME